MGGVGVFLSGWEREREREREIWAEREREREEWVDCLLMGMGGLLVDGYGWYYLL
jgi:hypothetical protein